MCYYDLAISSSRLSNLSCKLLDHYLLSACMPHVTGHFCVCHVELWLLFHDFFPVPGYLFLDLDLGTWVPGYLGTWVPGYLGTWVPGCLGAWVLPNLGYTQKVYDNTQKVYDNTQN